MSKIFRYAMVSVTIGWFLALQIAAVAMAAAGMIVGALVISAVAAWGAIEMSNELKRGPQ